MGALDETGYVHIVGCVDAAEAGRSIDGRIVDYGEARRTVRTTLDRVGEHMGGEWHCVKFRVTNNDAGDIAVYHRDAVAQSAPSAPTAAGYTIAVYADECSVDVVPRTHGSRGLGTALALASRVRLRVRAGDVVVRDARLIAREVLTKHAASRRVIYLYGCYGSRREMLRYAPLVAHATTDGSEFLNGTALFLCSLIPRSIGILSALAYANAALGYGALAEPGSYAFVASEGFQPRVDVGDETGPSNVFVVVGDAQALDAAQTREFTWVAYVRQIVVLAVAVALIVAVIARATRKTTQ
jgi:hypothetical protein